MTTLDDVVAAAGTPTVGFVKMDVEGLEVDVLRGAMECLRRSRPIVYGEFNNQLMPSRGATFTDVVELLRPLDYRFFALAGGGVVDERIDPPANLGNAALVPTEKAHVCACILAFRSS